MLTSDAIAEIVRRAAAPPLRGHTIVGVTDEPTQDAVGGAAVDIRIVLAGDEAMTDGDAVGNTFVDVHRALEAAGEDRTIMISFASEVEVAELAESIEHAAP